MRTRWMIMSLLASVVALLVLVSPAAAILGGQKDVANTFDNVGMISVQFPDGFMFGSCTLVDEGVVLTAAHCVQPALDAGGPGIGAIKVSFAVDVTPWEPGSETYYTVTRVAVHPDYLTAPAAGPNSKLWLGPGHEDVALVWLDEAPGIAPATVADADALDALDLKSAVFTAVGYGTTGFTAGSYMSWRNPNTVAGFDGRNFRTTKVINDREVFAERYVKMTACTGFGDSGGPTFSGDTVIADTVWGESMRCTSPAYEYRLDAARAQWFLRQYLPADRFAPLH